MKETLFRNISAVTLDEDAPVLRNAWVLVRDGRIASVGTEEPPHGPGCEIIDGTRKALLPSFVNAHTHLPMTVLRGYADGVPLESWLNDWIFPAEDRLDDRAVRAGTDLALAELAASGTTSASDMYMFCDVIAGCALDVFDKEPLDENDPLLQMDNVLLASHLAGTTLDSIALSPYIVTRDVDQIIEKGLTERIVNYRQINI